MAENKRENIIDAARKVFSQYGFAKTTMDEIAQAAHKGKSSIYYYFTSKEEIFEAVVKTEANILKEEILAKIEATDDPLEKIKYYIISRMNGIKKLGNFYNAMQNDFLDHLQFIENARKEYDQMEFDVICDILKEGNKKEVFDIQDPRLVAMALITIMKGLEIPIFIDTLHYDLENRIDDLLQLVYNGIKKR